MRKIIVTVILLCVLVSGAVFAKDAEAVMPALKFMGNKYTLYYSAKSPELGGYINEYYKQRESYASWSELLALHHYPSAFYPIEHAQAFKGFLSENGIPSMIEVDEDNNSAILDFIIINSKQTPIILEFNVFRYVKSPVCGSVGLQYAKRYRITDTSEIEKIKKDFAKNRLKYIKKVKKIKIPDLVTSDIEYGKYINPPSKKEEIKQEPVKQEEVKTEKTSEENKVTESDKSEQEVQVKEESNKDSEK